MPTDKQRMGEAFEKSVKHSYQGYAVDALHRDIEPYLEHKWKGFQRAWVARDAEVQALRKALQRLIAAIATERDVWTEADADHLNDVLADARAVLAGDKGTDDE